MSFLDSSFWLSIFSSSRTNRVKEDILKYLYDNKNCTLNQILFRISLPSKSKLTLLHELEHRNFISLELPYINLTLKGEKKALNIIRKHRLYETYLSEKTGVLPHLWHEKAEKMEHNISDHEANALEKELQFPLYDPHGDPIPNASGDWVVYNDESKALPLTQIKSGQYAKVWHIEDEPVLFYKIIQKYGVSIHSTLQLLSISDKKAHILYQGDSIELDIIVAANIFVIPKEESQVEKTLSPIRLTELHDDEKGKIVFISKECRGNSRSRILDLGFIKGAIIQKVFGNLLSDPSVYLVKNSQIALRNELSNHIFVKRI